MRKVALSAMPAVSITSFMASPAQSP
ncbi:hypothetical protein COLE_06989 [Cutaneotrichosporon oleaginosum]|nr:hypothetical protein COLE_06989 [Cutaneotrichosporon oleaginosum]